jgi:hypothetical protein
MDINPNNEEYSSPEVTVYGNIQLLTRSAGMRQRTDVPLGTEIGPGTTLDDITS